MRKRFLLICFSFFLALNVTTVCADEGSPLLSVDDLLALEDSYEAFLAELGDLAVFFCSPSGNNICGVAWNMDGGWTAQ